MSGKFEQLVQIVADGVYRANRLYGNWSRGSGLEDYSVEPVMVTEVARRIYELYLGKGKHGYIALEETFGEIWKYCGIDVENKKIPAPYTDRCKVDIAIWDNNDLINNIIELKRNRKAYWDDIRRGVWFVENVGEKRGGSLDGAIVGIFIEASGKKGTKSIEKLYSDMEEAIDEYFPNIKSTFAISQQGKYKDYKDYRYAGVAIGLRKKG